GGAHRQQQEPGGQDGLVPRGLEVERQAQQRPVQDQVEDQADGGGAAEVLVREEFQREDGVGVAAFGFYEGPGSSGADDEEGDGQRLGPALPARGDEAGGEGGQ